MRVSPIGTPSLLNSICLSSTLLLPRKPDKDVIDLFPDPSSIIIKVLYKIIKNSISIIIMIFQIYYDIQLGFRI
jgi:hypothetical protein